MSEQSKQPSELDEATDLRRDFLDAESANQEGHKKWQQHTEEYNAAKTVAEGLGTVESQSLGNNVKHQLFQRGGSIDVDDYSLGHAVKQAAHSIVDGRSRSVADASIESAAAREHSQQALNAGRDQYAANRDAIQEQALEDAKGLGYVPTETQPSSPESQPPQAA